MYTTCAVAVVLAGLVYLAIRSRQTSKLPPSFRPLPILGNIRDLPPKGVPEFRHWLRHKDECGPISSMTVFGSTIIILHDKQAAHDLLVRRSSKTSERTSFEFSGRMCGYGNFMVMQGNGDFFRRQKKLMHQQLGSKAAVAKFDELRYSEVRNFLLNMLKDPDSFLDHIRLKSSRIMLRTTYGFTPKDTNDPLIALNVRVTQNATQAVIAGKWLVDVLPWLRHLPSGLPGTGFKEIARLARAQLDAIVHAPYAFVVDQMAAGTHRPSYVSGLIEERSTRGDGDASIASQDRLDIQWTATALYIGGVDTSFATLQSFFLAMTLFPEAQARAQAELDRVVGQARMPAASDRAALPYIGAMVSETYRWWTIFPMGFPHGVAETIEYRGYTFPRGATVLPAAWWFMHDPDVYPEPDRFEPARFLEPRSEPDPRSDVFGYGRRGCPGQFMADEDVFLTIALTLAMFNIDNGGDTAAVNYRPGLIGYIDKFPCRITPRSAKHAELVREVELQPRLKSDSLTVSIENVKDVTIP